MKTVFLRALEADDKASVLLEAIHKPNATLGKTRFEVDAELFGSVPRSPFAYWISSRLGLLFTELQPFATGDVRTAKVGLQTSDDTRFVRAWWETPLSFEVERWFPFAKGEALSAFYGDVGLRVGYSRGDQVGLQAIGRYGRGADRYYRPGLTWALRARRFVPRALPAGCIFSNRGQSCFASDTELGELLGLLNSSVVDFLFKVSLGRFGFPEFLVGIFLTLPLPHLSVESRCALSLLARRGWSRTRSLDTRTETSHAFDLPALLQVEGNTVYGRVDAWVALVRIADADLATIQTDIDELCFSLYGITEVDRHAISEGFGTLDSEDESSNETGDGDNDDLEEAEEDSKVGDAASLTAELVSWAVGVAFGRFDIRLATGARPMPTEPEPFDPLPACSPGMLTGGDGLPLARPPTGYPLAFPETGVLVDDPGHARDLTAAVRAVFDAVFGAGADYWWNDVAALLDPKGHDLRVWLGGSFFEHHLKRHSKSRRKAPIVWQLGTPSGRYSVWLYAHRLTRDSFFQIQNEVVGPKLSHEERQLTSLMQNAGRSPSAAERKEIAAQEAVAEELRTMLDEVKRIAPLWNPNLDDGVVLTMAPLWRLVPQHKPWQKELRAKWDELAAGKYDWAHLAMHLWPERVVPKCATDRSLAIAHGLEDAFWADGANGKWQQRPVPMRRGDELVRERTSSAVKSALRSLLDAPAPGGTSKRTRKAKTDVRTTRNRP